MSEDSLAEEHLWAAVFASHRSVFIATAERITGSRNQGEDIVQDAAGHIRPSKARAVERIDGAMGEECSRACNALAEMRRQGALPRQPDPIP